MTIEARLNSLGQRHKDLDALIAQEIQRPYADDIKVHYLKRRKLAIKDEMAALTTDRKSEN
ncbi:YdcH family protein [Parvularcula sp. LCG005]|uniref:YdcH family protein n=1 Tax=Parvularcula sp. LCG005 TaxID=3078805 RepID=UPI002942B23D|nr:DUF465 domain-containing protein [Parvularcula sp. LCG005]WOI54550.1 DUF465 domain-containing protein [Parvularcula sp. LCG005]